MALRSDTAAEPSVASISIADPGPLGLCAFALTTFVLSAANAELIDASVKTIALTLALFYGGAVQVIAGIWEFRKGNTFGATAFCSYGGFWLSYWGISAFFKPAAGATTNQIQVAVGFFLLGWTIFTAIMLVASLRTSGALVGVFVALTVTFLLLTLANLNHNSGLEKAGGWLGILTAIFAWYAALAGVVNETWKRPALPIFKM